MDFIALGETTQTSTLYDPNKHTDRMLKDFAFTSSSSGC